MCGELGGAVVRQVIEIVAEQGLIRWSWRPVVAPVEFAGQRHDQRAVRTALYPADRRPRPKPH
jgi:hypothetical protein